MLFARFLAESDLLIEPESGVPISLEECRELAREEGVDWLALASDYAERMLPQIFRKDSPVLALSLPPETRFRPRGSAQGLCRGMCSRLKTASAGFTSSGRRTEGRGQPVGKEDRCGRTAGGHPALHRGLYGPLPAAQHAGRVVGRQAAGRQSGTRGFGRNRG